MTYSLYFWRQTKSLSLSVDEVCSQLCEDRAIDGVAELPIDAIRQAFMDAFPGMNGLSALAWEGDGSYFEVHWPPDPCNMLTVTCGYKLLESPDTMNRIIDVAARFGCAFYDPQTGKRYHQPDPET